MKFPARLFATTAVVLLSGFRSRTGSGSREVRLRHAATGQSRGAADQTLVQATDLISAARFRQPSETVKLDVFVVSRARPPTPFLKTATRSPPAPGAGARDLGEIMANGMAWVNGKRRQKTKILERRVCGSRAVQCVRLVQARLTLTAAKGRP